MSDRPTRKTLAALEKVFAAEIDGRPLFQSRAKIYADLCDEGLLQRAQIVLGDRFPVTIDGYELTHAGRFMWCDSCRDAADVE